MTATRVGRFGRRGLILVAAAVLANQPAHAQKRVISTSYDVEITTDVRPPASRMLRVSFSRHPGELAGEDFDRALGDSLKSMAETARAQASEIFAVANVFCRENSYNAFVVWSGCSMEGAWLKPGEKIVTTGKQNPPVYFSTAGVLAGGVSAQWYWGNIIERRLTGKVQIVRIAEGDPPLRIFGAQ